jgi:hypothetical protein
MSKLDLTEQHARERAGLAARVAISISRDDTRDHTNHRMLYVLGFGIVGTRSSRIRSCLSILRWSTHQVESFSHENKSKTYGLQRSRFCSRCLHRADRKFHPPPSFNREVGYFHPR